MKFVCDYTASGVRILRCFGFDGQVELPEKIHGMEVVGLGAYGFADIVRRQENGVKYLAWLREDEDDRDVEDARDAEDAGGVGDVKDAGEGGSEWAWEECSADLLSREELEDGTPVVKGNGLKSVSLPKGLKKIGAYAFYHCENLEYLAFYSRISDLGAGLFTGCYGVGELDVRMIPGEKSCLKEVLAELRQTLRVCCRDEQGEIVAKLVFPEYFEESIENTPARILTQEMHGCGHRYRNAFSGTEIQYSVYDKLFPHVQVQEDPELVTELVLGRLRYPVQLSEERKKVYETYAAEHGREIVKAAFLQEEEAMEILRFAGEAKWCTEQCMEDMLDEAGRRGNPQAAGVLMELLRRQRKGSGAEEKKQRRFAL